MKSRVKINNALGRRGLATLEKPQALLAQLAFCVKTHQQFRQLLAKVEIDKKRECYEQMRPYLRFEAKPLDVYIAEMGHEAEKQQLPTINENHEIVPYTPGEIGLRAKATEAIHAGAAWEKTGKSLVLTCAKCTRQSEFFGETLVEAITFARMAGWVYEKEPKEREICPKCPAVRIN